jgi:hypothetical protein
MWREVVWVASVVFVLTFGGVTVFFAGVEIVVALAPA